MEWGGGDNNYYLIIIAFFPRNFQGPRSAVLSAPTPMAGAVAVTVTSQAKPGKPPAAARGWASRRMFETHAEYS
jgi:hypothetical protein